MMLSRIADSLFWIGRYMERADNTARILDVNYHMLLEQPPDTYKLRWDPLIAITGDCGADGLGVIRGLIAETPSGTRMALEHDTHHGPAMQELLNEAETLRDYEGNERVSVGLAP